MKIIEKQENKIWTDLISLKTKEVLSPYSELVSVTKQGLTVQSKRKFFNISESDFPKFLNSPVELFLSQYEIPFYGVIKKIQLKKKDIFEIKLNFMESAPSYYRECVTDLLNYPLPA
ncbi:MAG: hypothetical protein OXJ52_03115 [Oligoflexia bacterium]|nr:hypothetical protein [Oligoflexia bacterium]